MRTVASLCVAALRPGGCAVQLDKYDLRRKVAGPRDGFMLTSAITMETVAPIPYDVLKEGIIG